MASIKKSTAGMSDKAEAKETRRLLEAALADLTALRAAHLALTAKLDADAGVTDTNYAELTNPAALELAA
jgi:hypothetical protein